MRISSQVRCVLESQTTLLTICPLSSFAIYPWYSALCCLWSDCSITRLPCLQFVPEDHASPCSIFTNNVKWTVQTYTTKCHYWNVVLLLLYISFVSTTFYWIFFSSLFRLSHSFCHLPQFLFIILFISALICCTTIFIFTFLVSPFANRIC